MQQKQSLAAIGQRYTDIVWAAGLFEGEGCIFTDKYRPNQRRLTMNMTDKDVMERFVNVVGYGNLNNYTYSEAKQSCHKATLKPYWQWKVAKAKEVLRILKMFLPHFGKRRAEKAIEAITHLNETIN